LQLEMEGRSYWLLSCISRILFSWSCDPGSTNAVQPPRCPAATGC
jgi:hypothetical protein